MLRIGKHLDANVFGFVNLPIAIIVAAIARLRRAHTASATHIAIEGDEAIAYADVGNFGKVIASARP